MKKLALLMCVVIPLLSACHTPLLIRKVQYVEVPVPMCPAPPDVPLYEYQVDKLQPTDAADPGKVGQAYKADMTVLRESDRIFRMIFEQYKNTSANFDEISRRIRELDAKLKAGTNTNDQ